MLRWTAEMSIEHYAGMENEFSLPYTVAQQGQ